MMMVKFVVWLCRHRHPPVAAPPPNGAAAAAREAAEQVTISHVQGLQVDRIEGAAQAAMRRRDEFTLAAERALRRAS